MLHVTYVCTYSIVYYYDNTLHALQFSIVIYYVDDVYDEGI